MAETKSRTFGHLTIFWTVSDEDKSQVVVKAQWDNIEVSQQLIVANQNHFNWTAQIDLSSTSGNLNASFIPVENTVALMVRFQNYSPDHGTKMFTGQLDSWSL